MPLGNPQFHCSGLIGAGKIIIKLDRFLSQQPQFLNEGGIRTLISRFRKLEGALREACVENTPGFLNERLAKINEKLQETLSNKDACLSLDAAQWIVEQLEGNVLFTYTEKSALRRKLQDLFSLSELHTLAFDMGYDYESIAGLQPNKDAFVRELIAKAQRKGELSILLNECEERRPNGNWQGIKLAPFPEWLEVAWWQELLKLVNKSLEDEIVNIDKYPVILLHETRPAKSQLEDITVGAEEREALVPLGNFQEWPDKIQQNIQQSAHCYAFNMYSASVMLAWRTVKLARSHSLINSLSQPIEKKLTQTIEEMCSVYIPNDETVNQDDIWTCIEQAIRLVELLHEPGSEKMSEIQSILAEVRVDSVLKLVDIKGD